jgi:hypothetical protein
MRCKGCGYTKQSEETFYSLTAGVKTNKSLYESLDKIVKGEVISDYRCD